MLRSPTTTVILGLLLGAVLGTVYFREQDAPGSTVKLLRDTSPGAYIARRQALRDARVPVGGFRSCAQAKAAGFGGIWRGEKAYSSNLDRDGDGKACEWNSGLLNWRWIGR